MTKLEDRDLKWLIKFHASITSREEKYQPAYWNTMVSQVEKLINEKQFKRKEMKSILIKFENELLADYVGNELKKKLSIRQVEPNQTIVNGKFVALVIKEAGTIAKFRYTALDFPNYKVFTITKAANADIIIEEIVKEYNKPEYKHFNIGGGFNNNKISVKVYDDRVEFNGQTMNFDTFIGMRNTLTQSFGGFQVGGEQTIQFTNSNTGTKVYIDRSELHPIVETILGKL